MAALPGTENVRFARPTNGPTVTPTPPKRDEFGSLAPQGWKRRHQGILQDKIGRSVSVVLSIVPRADMSRQQNGPIVPSLSLAFRLLLLMRTTGAMYSIISDCDEGIAFISST